MTKAQRERNMLLVEDLRTFKGQAKDQLRDGDRFCCLGRACEVFRLKTGRGHWDGNSFVIGYTREHKTPPQQVYEWYGWDDDDPDLDLDGPFSIETASHWNDYGRRFTTIARGFESLAKAK